jgi:hypothetical protein
VASPQPGLAGDFLPIIRPTAFSRRGAIWSQAELKFAISYREDGEHADLEAL